MTHDEKSYTGEIDVDVPGEFVSGEGYRRSEEYIIIHRGFKCDGPVHNPWEHCQVSRLTYRGTTSILELD